MSPTGARRSWFRVSFKPVALCVLACGAIAAAIFAPNAWGLWQLKQALDNESKVASARGTAQRSLAKACMSCHGWEGNTSHASYPSLAGQPADYLQAQLNAFAAGTRRDPIMEPMALALSSEQRRDLSLYFSASSREPGRSRSISFTESSVGRALTSSCVACHGQDLNGGRLVLSGKEVLTPRLSGQGQDYLIAQLKAFRDGSRRDANGTMVLIARTMSDVNVRAVSEHLSGQ